MPEISRFFGIIVRMYHDDHGIPHFHVYVDGHEAVLGIERLRLLEGSLRPKTLRMVVEWATQHQAELMEDWKLARRGAPLNEIPPLTRRSP